jgi:hypothetical protein
MSKRAIKKNTGFVTKPPLESPCRPKSFSAAPKLYIHAYSVAHDRSSGLLSEPRREPNTLALSFLLKIRWATSIRYDCATELLLRTFLTCNLNLVVQRLRIEPGKYK